MRDFEEFLKEQMENPEFREEYEALAPRYAIIRQLIQERIKGNLSQKELAEKIGVTQSNISRLESGSYNPSLAFLQKIAKGLGKELHLELR
ncbi:helix-turn-helix domain-containing protein [Aminivibrio sp.]|jgi:predicted transcriptional regulator|uniref:helix-turn-helix domain-containing protein n=1 Tax=Aminivibrio sp. TaxID=1872489 RepID=UPI0031CCF605|nr:XRE family transcriptional regulator [Verrucomicrobiae bacterium]